MYMLRHLHSCTVTETACSHGKTAFNILLISDTLLAAYVRGGDNTGVEYEPCSVYTVILFRQLSYNRTLHIIL